jgi:hypothetical protein
MATKPRNPHSMMASLHSGDSGGESEVGVFAFIFFNIFPSRGPWPCPRAPLSFFFIFSSLVLCILTCLFPLHLCMHGQYYPSSAALVCCHLTSNSIMRAL